MSELHTDTPLRAPRYVPPARHRTAARRARAFGALTAALLAIAAVVVVTLHHTHLAGPTTAGSAKTHKRAKSAGGPVADVKAFGQLSSAVSGAAAIPSGADGAVFFGGLDSASTPIATVQRFDGSHTSSAGTLPDPLGQAAAATLGGTTYLFGGSDTAGALPDIVSVDPADANVTVVGQLPQPTTGAAVVAVGGKAYVIGGYDGASDLDSIVSWDPTAGASTIASLPQPIVDAGAVVYDGDIYVVGGANSGATVFAIYRFDPTTNTVTKVGTLPIALTQPAVVIRDGQIIVLGGDRGVGVNPSSAIYSLAPATGRAKLLGALPQRLAGAMALNLASGILLAGGVEPSGQTNSTIYKVEIVTRVARRAKR